MYSWQRLPTKTYLTKTISGLKTFKRQFVSVRPNCRSDDGCLAHSYFFLAKQPLHPVTPITKSTDSMLRYWRCVYLPSVQQWSLATEKVDYFRATIARSYDKDCLQILLGDFNDESLFYTASTRSLCSLFHPLIQIWWKSVSHLLLQAWWKFVGTWTSNKEPCAPETNKYRCWLRWWCLRGSSPRAGIALLRLRRIPGGYRNRCPVDIVFNAIDWMTKCVFATKTLRA